MNNSSKIKNLITITLLSFFSGFAVADAEKSGGGNNDLAPEATATEARLSFRDIPNLKEAFIDTAPTDRKDGLVMGELGVDGGDKEMIAKLVQEIADGKHGKIDSLLIAHQGKLIFESYYLRGRVNLLHDQASAAKAYTSLALGRAIQLGYLRMADLDKPLVSFLKNLDPTKFVEGVEKITLHKALTMRGGLRISKEQREEFEKSPSQLKGQGQVQALLEHSEPITLGSQSYLYGNFNPPLVMQVIDAVVPGTAKDFIKNELLDKMGITNFRWRTNDVTGLPEAGWRVSMTSRDMLKWGTLVINKGKWNGEQLISADYLAKATSKITKPTEDWQPEYFNYGYFFYQTDITVRDNSYETNIAWGGGGQYIITVEELDLIVVISGHDREDTIFTQVSKTILPAFVKAELPVLSGPYLGQKPPGLTPEPFAPGIVTTEHYELTGVFTPDMKEFYLIRDGGKYEKSSLVVFKNKNNRWHESVISERVGTPIIAPDGKTMHLGKRYRKRTKMGWSDVKKLGSPFDDLPIMRLTASSKGTYFFDEFKSDFTGSIRYSRLVNGKHAKPKLLSKKINGGKSFHPFIAPDESYLIFDGKRKGGYGGSDLYISYRQKDSTWGEAINLGDKINTGGWEAVASVTPDGKYLFFNRNMNPESHENVDIFWVDAQFIETLKPQ